MQESLTRKLGPLPVWLWAIVAGAILYVVRSRSTTTAPGGQAPSAAATDAEAKLVSAEAQARASTMQSPQVISAGEQVYDPNSGYLSTPVNNDLNTGLLALIGTLLVPNPASPQEKSVPVPTTIPAVKQQAQQAAAKPTPQVNNGKPRKTPRARTHRQIHHASTNHAGHHQQTTKPKKKK